MPPTMTTQAGFAVASCLLALALALSSFERWLLRRRPHELAWAAGLGPGTVAAASLAPGAGAGGGLVLLGGCTWSAWRAPRTSAPRRRVVGNGLIATGTLVLGASGLLNSVVGEMTAFAVTLAAGLALLFAGFLVVTSEPSPDET